MQSRLAGTRTIALWMIALAWAGPAAQALASPSLRHRVQGALGLPTLVTLIAPDDPDLEYTEFVNSKIDAVHASFDRRIVEWVGNTHSPGTRISFTSNATRIRMQVSYIATFSPPGSGMFLLEVDGQLSTSHIGSDVDQGAHWYDVYQQATNVVHEFSLVYPYASDVDFLGLELEGGTPGLLAPPSRPAFLYVAHGDSITHGFVASSTAAGYPHKVAELRGWSVINMGFTGRKVDAKDGLDVGGLGADCVTIAIGVNDYTGTGTTPTPALTFTNRYSSLLSNLRSVQPTVPVFVVTPTWKNFEWLPNSIGLTLEDYRQLIRDVVNLKAVTDPELHLVEGAGLVPAGLAFFPDGIHPNDAGFDAYALSLEAAISAVLPAADLALEVGRPRAPHSRRVGRHGRGRSGTLGVPALELVPSASGATSLMIGNSSGLDTLGVLVAARDRESFGGLPDVLDSRPGGAWTAIPAAGLQLVLPDTLPVGEGVLLQVLQFDPAAPGGWSATRILSIRSEDRVPPRRAGQRAVQTAVSAVEGPGQP